MARDQSSTSSSEEPVRPRGSRLSGYHPVSRTTIHGWGSLLFGSPFFLVGLYITLIGFEVVEVDPSTIHAPMWVISVCGGVFLLAGLSLIVHSLAGMFRLARLNARKRAHPDQPWLGDYQWDPAGLLSRKTASAHFHFLGFAMTAGLLAVFNWAGFQKDFPSLFTLVAGFFDLVFVGIMISIVRKSIARARYGEGYLEFTEFPIRPGSTMRVRAHCQRDVQGVEKLSIRLHHVEERYETQGSGDNRSQVVACYASRVVEYELPGADARDLSTTGLELEFQIPEAAESTDLRARPASYWELELRAELPGPDLLHRFLIPIYGSAQSTDKLAA